MGRAIVGASTPTDFVKNLRAAGIDPNSPSGKQMIQEQITKLNNIPLVSLRQGGGAVNPQGKIVVTMPKMPENSLPIIKDGNIVGVTSLPGGAEINQMNSYATQAGKNRAEPAVGFIDGQPVFTDKFTAAQGGQPQNNPGNMRPAGASTGFRQFSTPQEGLAAMDQNLQAYAGKGINTLSGIISRWAPPSDNNNTQAYIADVSKRLGVDPNQPLDMSNPVVRQAISTGIMIHEQGSGRLFGQQQAPSGSRSAPLAPALAPGVLQGATNAQNNMDKRFSALQDANSQAQVTSSYLQNIKQQAQTAATGPFSAKLDYINGLLSLAGVEKATDAVTANDLLDKYSNQIVARLGTGGLGTDAARAILQSAYPNAHMTQAAINDAADNLVGANEMIKAKTSLLSQPGNNRDPAGYQQKEQVFDQNADPRLWQYIGKTPGSPAAKQFLQGVLAQDPTFIQKAGNLAMIGAIPTSIGTQMGNDLKAATAPVTGKTQSSPLSVSAPNGKTYYFNDAKSAANFRLKAGL